MTTAKGAALFWLGVGVVAILLAVLLATRDTNSVPPSPSPPVPSVTVTLIPTPTVIEPSVTVTAVPGTILLQDAFVGTGAPAAVLSATTPAVGLWHAADGGLPEATLGASGNNCLASTFYGGSFFMGVNTSDVTASGAYDGGLNDTIQATVSFQLPAYPQFNAGNYQQMVVQFGFADALNTSVLLCTFQIATNDGVNWAYNVQQLTQVPGYHQQIIQNVALQQPLASPPAASPPLLPINTTLTAALTFYANGNVSTTLDAGLQAPSTALWTPAPTFAFVPQTTRVKYFVLQMITTDQIVGPGHPDATLGFNVRSVLVEKL